MNFIFRVNKFKKLSENKGLIPTIIIRCIDRRVIWMKK